MMKIQRVLIFLLASRLLGPLQAFLPATTVEIGLEGNHRMNHFEVPSRLQMSERTLSMPSSSSEVMQLKEELMMISNATDRGFTATAQQVKQARELIFHLSSFNPTKEPAKPYYSENNTYTIDQPSLAGKWTLIFSDAPDITGLSRNGLAELGRIGQDCSPPYIKNVIEWKRPNWATGFPLSGPTDARILQKVVTKASASSEKPTLVYLELKGFQVGTDAGTEGNLVESIQKKGLVAGLLAASPFNLPDFFTAPFGQFEVLYLDEDLRVTRTGQNYITVNVRNNLEDEKPWF